MSYTSRTARTSPNFTPAVSVPAVYGQPRIVKGITIHHWGAEGQQFDNVENELCTPGVGKSAHYIVQGGLVSCIVDPDDAAWHAGNATGNATTVGIECRPEATAADYTTAAELIRELRKVYGDLPLYPHRHWYATICPGKWDLARLDRLARTGTNPAPPKPAPKPTPAPAKPAPVKPAAVLVNRTVTNPVAYARKEPRSTAPVMATIAHGAPLAVKGYVAGEDPYGTGDDAWYVTKSGYYVWANAASNDLRGLPRL